ncbi:MAG: S41 family peptidase [Rickettsiales bacterium]|nr:S41 family peptidase [Rickettsiales bacterium]
MSLSLICPSFRSGIIALFLSTSLVVAPACALEKAAAPTADASDTYEMLNLFGDVFERVRKDYVEEVTDKQLIESAINGMLTALDPHSGYLNEQSFKEMQVQTRGEFGGLGIEVTMENGLVKVVSPIDDTPAFKAGVHAGDYISEIDGEAVMGLTLSEAVEKMRGSVGSSIKLTILRENASEPLMLTLTRDLIRIKSVRSHPEADIGYVRVTSFSEQTSENMVDAIRKMRKDNSKMKGLVLDLRNNPGGLLDQAVSVSDAFLDHGEIVSTRERDPNNTKRYSATKGDVIDGLPMVVLINQGSASASEIVAGALQDHDRAIIMGVKSFGKGSVQTVIPLREHGAMRLTTSRYYTPSGHSIQAKGITPDIEVEQAKISKLEESSLIGIRSEAELRGRLSNPEDEQNAKPSRTAPPASSIKDGKPIDPKLLTVGGMTKDDDFQLARALDLLRGIAIYHSHEQTQSK